MNHESTDRHRARVGGAVTAALIAVALGWFPANEVVYLLFGRTTDARVTDLRTGKGFRQRALYIYQDAGGTEHADSGLVERSLKMTHGNSTIPVQYHALPWRGSRPAGIDWLGLGLFGVAAGVAAWLAFRHRRDLRRFWRRERQMAGF